MPFAQLAGFAIQSASAAAQSGVTAFVNTGDSYFVENEVRLSLIVTDKTYDAEPRLYAASDETEEIGTYVFNRSTTDLYFAYYYLDAELWSGDFILYLDLKKDGVLETTVPIDFTVPDKQPFSVYLFGPTDPITDLYFFNPRKEYIEIPEYTLSDDNGYVKYTIQAYPGACFTLEDLEHDYSFSSSDWLCTDYGWEYVVHAVDGEFAVDLLDHDVELLDGEISGWIKFDEVYDINGDPPAGEYQLTVVDRNGSESFCAWVEPEVELNVHFDCEEVPADPVMLRIDLVNEEVIYPTNAILMLEAVDLPDTSIISDLNPEIGWVEPVVQFYKSDDESEIALYKIVPPYDPEYGLPDKAVYIPADGSLLYTVIMEKFKAYLGDTFSIRMIDTLGRDYAIRLDIPVNDKISALEGLFDYELHGCSDESIPLSYTCYSMNPLQNVPEPDDAVYSDGRIAWTAQDIEPFDIAGYDIYFADAVKSIIRGDARINLLPDGQPLITHALEHVPQNAEYAAVVTLLVHPEEYYDYSSSGVYYSVEPFYIRLTSMPPPGPADPQELELLQVNGIDALQDEVNPYHYIAYVDEETEAAAITASSPNGVILINGEMVVPGVSHTVALEEDETDVTIVVQSPDDEGVYIVYQLTIIKAPQPGIQLVYYDIYGDEVRIWWEITGAYDPRYEVDLELYQLVDGSEFPVEPADSLIDEQGQFAKLIDLQPAAYKLAIRLKLDGQVLDEDYREFAVTGPQPMNFYVFGPDEVISDLVITKSPDDESVEWTHSPGNGYVKYTIMAEQGYRYSLHSDTYQIAYTDYYHSSDDWDFVVHASDSDYEANLYYYSLETSDDGDLSGKLWFNRVGEYEDYRLVVVDRDGAENACWIETPYNGDGMHFECADLPEDPLLLRIDAVVGEAIYPTSAVLRIDNIELPEDISLVDADPRAGWLDLTVQFDRLENESDIAFYKIRAPKFSYATGRSLVVANGQEASYAVHLGKLETHPGDQAAIQLIDTDGYPVAREAVRPVVDVMTGQSGLLDYESCYSEAIGCEPSELYETFTAPADAGFTDEDPGAGARSGIIEWSLPEAGLLYPVAYDLYYADDDMSILRGEARVNLYHLTGTFQFRLSDVPQNAEYAAVVALLKYAEDSSFVRYHTQPFYIPLDDLSVFRLNQLRVNGNDAVQNEADPTRYTVQVDADAVEAEITALSQDGIVLINGEVAGPEDKVTVVLDDVEVEVTIVVRSSIDEELFTSYTLTIIKEQQQPTDLVLSTSFIAFEDGSYGYVPKSMTVSELMDRFLTDSGTDKKVYDKEDNALEYGDQVEPGSKLVLTNGNAQQIVQLRLLSDLLRQSETEPITITHIAVFIIQQLNAAEPADVTGDGIFDSQDVRLLLDELEY